MKSKLNEVAINNNSQDEIVALRKTTIASNLPVTSRVIRLHNHKELLDSLINNYVFHSEMQKKAADELVGFLSYIEQLYTTPETIAEFTKQNNVLASLPFLLSVIRYEVNLTK